MRSRLLFFILILTAVNIPSLGYAWSINLDSGSTGNPYQISKPKHLMSVATNTALLDKHLILINDIVFDPNNNQP